MRLAKKLAHKNIKIGSIQRLIEHEGCAEDISCSLFSNYEVQKIALLDLRILNDDRHEGNILFQRKDKQVKLFPIDHGLSIPDNLHLMNYNICWFVWKQVYQPIEPELKEYILSINPKKNYNMLKKRLDLRSECLRNLRIAETFLQKCVG